MNDLLNYFFHGSCGTLKKSMQSGLDIFTLLFIFLCVFFMLGKGLALIIHFFMLTIKKIFMPKDI